MLINSHVALSLTRQIKLDPQEPKVFATQRTEPLTTEYNYLRSIRPNLNYSSDFRNAINSKRIDGRIKSLLIIVIHCRCTVEGNHRILVYGVQPNELKDAISKAEHQRRTDETHTAGVALRFPKLRTSKGERLGSQ